MTHILVIEDDPTIQSALTEYLQHDHFTVVSASDAVRGILLAEQERPDLILMDMRLPSINGFEATRRLRQEPGTRDIPIIALTARSLTGDRERCLDAGCNDFISKPIRFGELRHKIDALLH